MLLHTHDPQTNAPIQVNLNIPPAERFKKRNMFLVGFIPGPNNPKYLDSFIFPLVQEFLQLESGVPDVWNSAQNQHFTLKAHICVAGADKPGREKLMNFKGNHGSSYCPYCYVHGVHNRGVYCPLDPPVDSPTSIKKDIISGWRTYDPSNLPMRSDHESWKIANHVLCTGDDKAAKSMGLKTHVASLSFLL